MTEWKNQNSPLMASRPGGSIRTSIRSANYAARLRDLLAREELAQLELQRIEAAANLARIIHEKLKIKEKEGDLDKEPEDKSFKVQSCIQTSSLEVNKFTSTKQKTEKEGDLDKEPEDKTFKVQSCIQTSSLEVNKFTSTKQRTENRPDDLDKEVTNRILYVQNYIQTSPSDRNETEYNIPEQDLQENLVIVATEQPLLSAIQVITLSDQIQNKGEEAVKQPPLVQHQPAYSDQELPYYDGKNSKWVAFENVYGDTLKKSIVRTSRTDPSGSTATEITEDATKKRTELSALLTEQKTADKNMNGWKNQNSPVKKLSPGGSIHASVRSTRSSDRLRDLLGREELAHLELKQRLEAAANMKLIRLENQGLKERKDEPVKELENETSLVQNSILTSQSEQTEFMFLNEGTEEKLDDLDKELADGISKVQNCIQTSPLDLNEAGDTIRREHLQKNKEIMKTEQPILHDYYTAVTRETKKKVQLDRSETYTATEEDEGGGVLRKPTSRGAGTVAISGGRCYAQGGDCWREYCSLLNYASQRSR